MKRCLIGFGLGVAVGASVTAALTQPQRLVKSVKPSTILRLASRSLDQAAVKAASFTRAYLASLGEANHGNR